MVLWNLKFFVLTRTNERKTFLCLLGNFFIGEKLNTFCSCEILFYKFRKKKDA